MEIIAQPDIYLWDFRIQEPVTTLTDLLISAICILAFFLLRKVKNKSSRSMRIYFLFMAIATFLGAIFGHAFVYKVGFYGRFPGWYVSMFAIMFIERSAIQHAAKFIPEKKVRILLMINVVELMLMMGLTSITEDFRFVQFHSAYGILLFSASFHLYVYIKSNNKASKLYLYSVLVLILATIVFNYPVVLSPYFNHLDFAHCLMAVATWMFYRSTKRMET